MKSLAHRLFATTASLLIILSTNDTAAEEVLTLYTQRHYEFDEAVQKEFTEKTGIRIQVVKASSDELITRLQEEGERTPADLYLTADGGGLDRAKKAGLLQPMVSETISDAVPAPLRDPEGHWVALTKRARVLVYAPNRVAEGELSTYEDLADPKWRGRLVARSSSNIYNQSLMTTLIEANGSDEAGAWAAAVRKNMARPPQGSDRDQIRAVATGLADVALANTYYLGLLVTSEDPKDREAAAAVKLFFPNQEGRGAHVNISGAGIVKASKKQDLAVRFLEFLLSEDIQAKYAAATHEYPVIASAPWSDLQKSWGEFKSDEVPFSVLGERNAEAVRLFNRAGWE